MDIRGNNNPLFIAVKYCLFRCRPFSKEFYFHFFDLLFNYYFSSDTFFNRPPFQYGIPRQQIWNFSRDSAIQIIFRLVFLQIFYHISVSNFYFFVRNFAGNRFVNLLYSYVNCPLCYIDRDVAFCVIKLDFLDPSHRAVYYNSAPICLLLPLFFRTFLLALDYIINLFKIKLRVGCFYYKFIACFIQRQGACFKALVFEI